MGNNNLTFRKHFVFVCMCVFVCVYCAYLDKSFDINRIIMMARQYKIICEAVCVCVNVYDILVSLLNVFCVFVSLIVSL